MNKITLKDIAGYATERAVWQMMSQLAAGTQVPLGEVTPERVEIRGDRFHIADERPSTTAYMPFAAPEAIGHQGVANEQATVWSIGAMAFYMLMGVGVFEGDGGAGQQALTPVPRVGSTHCGSALGNLIHRCLAFQPTERPTVAELRQCAESHLAEKPLAPRRLTAPSGRAYKAPLMAFWPEEIFMTIALLLALALPSGLSAQNDARPQELTAIVERCIMLRDTANATAVSRQFSYDSKWTLMDELAIDHNAECTVRDKVTTLGLNSMGYRIAKLHGGVNNTGGRFRNGQDKRYNYSFIEVTARRGATLHYDITGREGRQMFAVVPISSDAPFTAELSVNGNRYTGTAAADGVVYITVDNGVRKQDVLKLSIENKAQGNMSYVIVNYNSRQ